jgi:hypothetical protein
VRVFKVIISFNYHYFKLFNQGRFIFLGLSEFFIDQVNSLCAENKRREDLYENRNKK